MKENPKVSIVIPVYNGADFLASAIDSALSQTYANTEVLVVNDGSTDNGATERIAISYGDRIRYISKENGGVASALNCGIRNMDGDYFSWLSHDDLYCPNKISTQIDSLKRLPEDVILYSDWKWINERSETVGTHRVPHVPPSDFRFALLTERLVHGCSVLVPRKAFDALGMFREDLRTVQDLEMWHRLSARFDFVHRPEVLISSRIHAGQGSVTLCGVLLSEADELFILMIRGLSEEYLLHRFGPCLARTYSRISIRLAFKKAYHASRFALGLGGRKIVRTPILTLYGCAWVSAGATLHLFALSLAKLKIMRLYYSLKSRMRSSGEKMSEKF